MAIETQLYLKKAGFPFCESNNLRIDNIPSCLNSQAYSHRHHLQAVEQQCLQHLSHVRQMIPNMSLIDPSFSCISNSNVQSAINKYNHSAQPLASYPQGLYEQKDTDHCFRSQNEKLRILLEEQRKQHVTELLKKVELNAFHFLRQKEEEIAEARKKSRELKEFVRRLEVENQWWRKVAKEKEAMVCSLHNAIEQMKERAVYWMAKDDAESCCDDNMRNTAMEEGTGENRVWRGGVEEDEQSRKRTMDCKCCNSQKPCFMFLPCRHLCSCQTCEPFLQVCPVCSVPKKSRIEIRDFNCIA